MPDSGLPDNVPAAPLADLAEKRVGSGLREHETYSNIVLREKVAKYLLYLFIGTNTSVLVAIGVLAGMDCHITNRLVDRAATQPAAFEKLLGSPDLIEKTRSVNSGVLMTLIGATAVQVGAGVLTMTQYLFPKQNDSGNGK